MTKRTIKSYTEAESIAAQCYAKARQLDAMAQSYKNYIGSTKKKDMIHPKATYVMLIAKLENQAELIRMKGFRIVSNFSHAKDAVNHV
jgi:hypothetical protein